MKKIFFVLLIVFLGYFHGYSQNTNQDWGRNIISVNYLNFFNGNLHIQYERILRNPLFGIKTSVNINVKEFDNDLLSYRRKFTAGADFNIYPTGQGKVKYFVGPAFRVGVLTEQFANSFFSGNFDYNYYSFFLSNGFHIQAGRSLYLSFQAAIGIGFFDARNKSHVQTPQIDDNFSEPDGIIAFNMGWRF